MRDAWRGLDALGDGLAGPCLGCALRVLFVQVNQVLVHPWMRRTARVGWRCTCAASDPAPDIRPFGDRVVCLTRAPHESGAASVVAGQRSGMCVC